MKYVLEELERHITIHRLADILDPGKSREFLKIYILTILRSRIDPDYHASTQNQTNFCTTEETSEDDYVSQQAEKYHMKVAESNLSAELFYHIKYMICTNRKKTFVDLPPTSAGIPGHLLQTYCFTNISLKIFDTTKSSLQLLNFSLREILKKFIIRCACKKGCGNRCGYKKYERNIENIRIVKIYNFL